MAVIDFKSVGEKVSSPRLQPTINEKPIGIVTPLRLGTKNDGLFAMHFNIADQIQDNFRNLLLSNHGERLGRYDFGANLRYLSFENGQDAFDANVISNIRTAVDKYMPFLTLQSMSSNVAQSISGMVERVNITVTYSVPLLGIIEKELEVSIFIGG